MRPGPPVLADPRSAAAAFARPLPRAEYDRRTLDVARALLGRLFVRRVDDGWRAGRIVETEAYVEGDRANHAVLGPSMRNRSMFGPPGTLYVYRIHQVHCANAVTRPGEAVLLRSVEPVVGLPGDPRGPGRLCRAFGIGRELDGTSLVDGPVRIGGADRATGPVARGVRVGIRLDAHRPLRFALRRSPWVSSPRISRERAT